MEDQNLVIKKEILSERGMADIRMCSGKLKITKNVVDTFSKIEYDGN